ncbi:MAG: glutaredoxin family protein [Pseudomonadota bacterium]
MRLVLYTRRGCHLCEDMLLDLELLSKQRDFSLQIVDIDTDPELVRRYGQDVPVLTDQTSRLICQHRLDSTAVTQFIANQ